MEHSRAEEEVIKVSTQVAPKPKKVRSGQDKAKAKTTVKMGGPTDNVEAEGHREMVMQPVMKSHKCKQS